jgi:hypothetical protein
VSTFAVQDSHVTGPHRFSLIRPNPFLGTLQVLELEGARAISPDGVNWEIQVVAEGPANLWGSLNQGRRGMDFYTFGVWSRQEGLARVPINPLFDIGMMLAQTERIAAELESDSTAVPFPPLPAFELWLLDEAQAKPLALLAFARDEQARQTIRPRRWAAATGAIMHSDRLSGRLLTLPELTDATRKRMEQAARRQALTVDRLWRVYPKIIGRGLIDAARVEARLRRAHASVE